jgi:hypothetical protein
MRAHVATGLPRTCPRGGAENRATLDAANPVTMHPATLPPADLLKQTQELHTRRSGPGGQHRNKTQTAVVLAHKPTGIAAEAAERRSQAENRQVALQRLRLKLALEHRTQALPGPSRLWLSRTRGQQLVVAASHDDYASLLAEALDQLQAHRFELAPVAEKLGVTSTQLARLFKKHPAAWTALNRHRATAGLKALQ